MANLSRTNFTYEVAAVEFFHVRLKGHLKHCRAALDDIGIRHPTKHTVPMTKVKAALYCSHFAALGYGRLGGGMVLQRRRGLRPGELLSLRATDLAFSDEAGGAFGAPTSRKYKIETSSTRSSVSGSGCRSDSVYALDSRLYPLRTHVSFLARLTLTADF